jgi:hypothetical protein
VQARGSRIVLSIDLSPCTSSSEGQQPCAERPSSISAAVLRIAAGSALEGRGPLNLLLGDRALTTCRDAEIYRGSLFELRSDSRAFRSNKNRSRTQAQPIHANFLMNLEAPPGFEPGMEVLQTSALPLGDGAVRESRQPHIGRAGSEGGRWSGKRDSNPRLRPWQGRTLPLSYSRSRRTLTVPHQFGARQEPRAV